VLESLEIEELEMVDINLKPLMKDTKKKSKKALCLNNSVSKSKIFYFRELPEL
jgi:hypothetical protein